MEKAKIKRAPKRALYDPEEINEILDKSYMCHISFVHNGYPVCIPTMYGRLGSAVYIHGASVSRLITELEKGVDMCLSVAEVNGLVLARSAFHHSLNYESVVIFGKGKLVEDNEKLAALKAISDQALPGRWEEVRLPSAKELKATKVIRIDIEEASAKRRTGPPVDDKADYKLNIWAGVVPLEKKYKPSIADELLIVIEVIEQPESVKELLKKQK
jgi:hypothetical protein